MTDRDVVDSQKEHWQRTYANNPDMYGTRPSEPGRYAIELLTREGSHELLELGAGQGRDTFAFLASGLQVTALDYAAESLRVLHDKAVNLGVGDRLRVLAHDVRDPLPLPDATFDAVYSHMLFNMALTGAELEALADDVRRVLRPGGPNMYTVRHVGDPYVDTGINRGDGMFENDGFIVHFFDRPLVERLAQGFGSYRRPFRGSAGAPLLRRRASATKREVPDGFEYFGCSGAYRSVLRRWRRAGARCVPGGISRRYS